MGCSFSCWSSSPSFRGIRVVHLSGFVEEFADPKTVSEIIGKPAKHFLCSSTHLLSYASQPLGLETRIERGRVYFLLPHSIFNSDSSPVDLASLATRLTAIAKRGPSPTNSPFWSPSSPLIRRRESATGTCRIWKRVRGITQDPNSKEFNFSYRIAGSWKPILETIQERSFRGSSNDLKI